MRRPVNFNLTKNKALLDIQTELCDDLQADSVAAGDWTFSSGFDAASLNVSFFLPREGHVLLPFTAADRNYLFRRADDGSYMMTQFQTLLLPGRWLRRRLLKRDDLGFSPSALIPVGSPRLDRLRRLQAARPRAEDREQKRVLWVPTSPVSERKRKADVEKTSSQSALDEAIPRLSEICELVHFPDLHAEDFDRARLTEALLDVDVVITDCDPILYDAWALGKPVIFTTWLVGEHMAERYPGTAETYLYQNLIGLHADSLDHLCELITAEPDLGTGVEDFMLDYFENYIGPRSGSLIRAALDRIRDPEFLEAEARLDTRIEQVLSLLPSKTALAAPPAKPRVSIQMAQLALIRGAYDLFDETARLVREASGAASLKTELAGLKTEAFFMQDRADLAKATLSTALETTVAARHYTALRVALAEGDLEGALSAAIDALGAGAVSPSVHVLLARALQKGGRSDIAISLLLRQCKLTPSADLLNAAVELVCGERDWRDFAAGLREVQSSLIKSLGEAVVDRAYLSALARGGRLDEALPLALALTRNALAAGAETAATPLTGWQIGKDLPVWNSAFEAIAGESALRSASLVEDASSIILGHVARLGLAVFPTGATLRALCRPEPGAMPPGAVDLAVIGTEAATEAAEALAATGYLMLSGIDGGHTPRTWRFRAANGVSCVLRRLEPMAGGGLTLHDSGVVTRLPGVSLTPQKIGAHLVPVPSDIDGWLAALTADDSDALQLAGVACGRDNQIVDKGALALALFLDIIDGRLGPDPARLTAAVALLRDLGHPHLWFQAAEMHDKILGPGVEHMSDLIRSAKYLLHIGDGIDGAFYVDLWYPYCKAGDPHSILAVRTQALFNYLRDNRPDLDVILLKTQMDAEWLISNAPELKAVMFVSNVGNNLHIYRFNHLTHIWLGHGDSDKVASCHKAFRAYDEVWCAGRAQIDRFLNAGFDHSSVRFRVVGRPTLRERLPQIEAATLSGFLYLPTWEGNLSEQSYSSVELCETFLPEVVRITGFEGVTKFHPWVGRRLAHLNVLEQRLASPLNPANSGLRVAPREQLAADLMTDARFMIADVSSVVSDYLVTGRPIFLYKPQKANLRMATSAMPLESYCYVFHTVEELAALMQRVIVEGDDFLGASRAEARQYFVDITRTMNGQFEKEMAELLHQHPSNLHPWHVSGVANAVAAPRPVPLIVGHRGAKALYCENSLEGFAAVSKIAGLDAIELDVHMAADGVPVVIHDATVDRTTTGSGHVRDFTSAQLAAMRLRWTPPGAAAEVVLSEGVPTLDQVLALLKQTSHRLFIEIKSDALGNASPGLEAKVLTALRAHGMIDRCTLTSFAPNVLHRLRALDSDVPLLASVNFRSIEMLGGLQESLRQFALVRNCGLTLETKLIAALKASGGHDIDLRRVGEWVVNSVEGLDQALQGGRREIFTDNPVRALERRAKAASL